MPWPPRLNHVGQIYRVMEDVFRFAQTFKEHPPRSFPPSFNWANIMEETLRDIKAGNKLHQHFQVLVEAPRPAPK